MTIMSKRTQSEVDDQLDAASEHMHSGSRWPGMTYEEGVEAALRWITGEDDTPPMEDES